MQLLHLRMPPQSIPFQRFLSVFCALYSFVFGLSFFASMQQSPPGCTPYLGSGSHPAVEHFCHPCSNFPKTLLLQQDLQPRSFTQDALAQYHWSSSNQNWMSLRVSFLVSRLSHLTPAWALLILRQRCCSRFPGAAAGIFKRKIEYNISK